MPIGDAELNGRGGAGQSAVGVKARGDGILVERLAEQRQGRGVVSDRIAGRELGAARSRRRPGGRHARTEAGAAHQFVPVLAQARLDLDVLARTPVVKHIRRLFEIRPAELAAALEHRARQQLVRHAELFIAGALVAGIVVQTVNADAGLDLVHAGGLEVGQKCVDEDLIAARALRRIDEVVTAAAFRRNDVQCVALRELAQFEAVLCDAQFDERAMAEVDLVLQTPEVFAGAICGSRGNGVEDAEPETALIGLIDQEVGEDDVDRTQIHLGVQHVGALPAGLRVLPLGQAVDPVDGVLKVEVVGEPGVALPNGSGNDDARRPTAHVDAAVRVEPGNEVGRIEAELIGAVVGLQGQNARGAFPKLGRIAAGEELDGLHTIQAHLRVQPPGDGIADVEPIQRV